MNYVYLIESVSHRGRRYVGKTTELKKRIVEHYTGKSPYTAKFKPWKLCTYLAFSSEAQAISFEQYIKSGSGHAFC